jgi:hypothetical protein
MIVGRWRLQTVLVNDEPYQDSTHFHLLVNITTFYFQYSNSLNVRTIANGKLTETADGFYKFEGNKSKIFMRFTLLWDYNEITAKIKKLTNRELHLEYEEKGDIYYLKLFSN